MRGHSRSQADYQMNEHAGQSAKPPFSSGQSEQASLNPYNAMASLLSSLQNQIEASRPSNPSQVNYNEPFPKPSELNFLAWYHEFRYKAFLLEMTVIYSA